MENKNLMRDVQKEADERNIQIDRVGVKGVSYPVIIEIIMSKILLQKFQ